MDIFQTIELLLLVQDTLLLILLVLGHDILHEDIILQLAHPLLVFLELSIQIHLIEST